MTPPRPTVLLVFFAALTAPLGAEPAPEAGAPAAAGSPAAAAKPAPPPLSPRFKQIRERIYGLYHYRNETPPAPNPATNPFRPPGAAPVSTPPASSGGRGETPSTAVSQVSTADLALLQQSVAALKVSATMEKDGKMHVVIKGKPYKQGDVIQILSQGETVYLRVRQVSRNSIIFALNETEMTLRF